jgi:hypothetical protein
MNNLSKWLVACAMIAPITIGASPGSFNLDRVMEDVTKAAGDQ